MLNRQAIIFPLILAIMLALVTFWINQTVLEQGLKLDGSNRHDPDYKVYNFVTTHTGPDGKIRYMLSATEMAHYPDNDSTVLQLPRFTSYSADKPFTKIQGQRGHVSSDGEEVEFLDDVIVTRQATAEKGEMQLLTERLFLEPNKDIARTDEPVTITQAPKTVIQGVGMLFDKKNQTLTLHSRVKAHYEKPAPIEVSPKTNTKTNTNTKKTTTKKTATKK